MTKITLCPRLQWKLRWNEPRDLNKFEQTSLWYSITRYNKYMWWKLCQSCFESADTAKSAMLPPWPCQVKTTQERIDGRSSPLRCGWCKDKHHISSHSKYVMESMHLLAGHTTINLPLHYVIWGPFRRMMTCCDMLSLRIHLRHCLVLTCCTRGIAIHSCQKPRSRGFCRNSKLEALEAREN